MCWKTHQEVFPTNILGGSKSSQTDTTVKVKHHKYSLVVIAFVSYVLYHFKLLVDTVEQQKDEY